MKNIIFPTVRNIIRLIIRSNCGVDTNAITFNEYLTICVSTKGITNQLNWYMTFQFNTNFSYVL